MISGGSTVFEKLTSDDVTFKVSSCRDARPGSSVGVQRAASSKGRECPTFQMDCASEILPTHPSFI